MKEIILFLCFFIILAPATADWTDWCDFPNVKKGWYGGLFNCCKKSGGCNDAYCYKKYSGDSARITTVKLNQTPQIAEGDSTFKQHGKCWDWACKPGFVLFENNSCITTDECVTKTGSNGQKMEVSNNACVNANWCEEWSTGCIGTTMKAVSLGSCKGCRCMNDNEECFASATDRSCKKISDLNKTVASADAVSATANESAKDASVSMQFGGYYVDRTTGICEKCGDEKYVKITGDNVSCADGQSLQLKKMKECYGCNETPDYLVCTGMKPLASGATMPDCAEMKSSAK